MAEQSSRKKQKKFAPTTKLTGVATTLLLDDAIIGFKNGNFVCSPFSLEILLGMLAAGAEGRTLKQLLWFLGHETLDQLLYESPSAKLCKVIESRSNGGVDVSLGNGVWVAKKTSSLKSCYEETLKTVYETKARFLDFRNKPREAVREINSWCDKTTKGLIPYIVNEGDIHRDTKIIIANALYFKGSWFRPFNFTTKKDFHLINGEKKTVSVPFMTSDERFDYGSVKDYKILKLPYESEGQSNKLFSMYIFLPHNKDGLQDLLHVFHSDPDLFRSRFHLKQQKLDELWIPKFKISYKFDAHDVMQQMGLTLPFYPMNNDLTRIIDSKCLDEDMLYVSNILQKCFIEIDEEGTEAAACSIMSIKTSCRHPKKPPPPVTFVVDHPFMFMIREDISQAIFFIGAVINPLA